MRQYRPDVERQKLIYSRMKSRTQIPDNSELWHPFEVTCVADARRISDQIHEDMQKRYLAGHSIATEDHASEMLVRFITPKVAEAALAHSSGVVRHKGYVITLGARCRRRSFRSRYSQKPSILTA
jgi:hypothetical protein